MRKRRASERLESAERERQLRELFDTIKVRRQPTWPKDFCARAGIDKSTLRRFPVLAAEVNEYGWAMAPSKMRRAHRVAPRKAAFDDRAAREHKRWSKELPRLRETLKQTRAELEQAGNECERLSAAVSERERLIEALLARFATSSPAGLLLAEDIIRVYTGESASK